MQSQVSMCAGKKACKDFGAGKECFFLTRENRMPDLACEAHLVQLTSHLGSHSHLILPEVLHIRRPEKQGPVVWNELDPGV